MNPSPPPRPLRAAGRPILRWALLVSLTAGAWAAGTGERWQTTAVVTVGGLALPTRTQESCQPPGFDATPPVSPDERCRVTSHLRAGNTVSFAVACGNGATGRGSVLLQGGQGGGSSGRGYQRFDGDYQLEFGGRSALVTLQGQRLAGTCELPGNGSPQDALAAAMASGVQRAQNDGVVRPGNLRTLDSRCLDAVAEMRPDAMALDGPCAAEHKPVYCRRLQRHEGYAVLARRALAVPATDGEPAAESDLERAAAQCQEPLPALRGRLCAEARRAGDQDFLALACAAPGPAPAQVR